MLAYAHAFKTAGTTFTGILRRNFSIHHFDTRLIPPDRPPLNALKLKRALTLYPRIDSIAGHSIRPFPDLKDAFPEMRFYTFLREPRARLISAFLFIKKTAILKAGWQPASNQEIEESFLAFCDKYRNGLCNDFAPGAGSVDAAIEAIENDYEFVGLVEHFDESLALFRNWVGLPSFDLRYRRLNISQVGQAPAKQPPTARQKNVDHLVAVTGEVTNRLKIKDRMTDALQDDIALFEHARTRTFERMRRNFSAGLGPFDFEDSAVATDTIAGRLYRHFIGWPFVGRYAALRS